MASPNRLQSTTSLDLRSLHSSPFSTPPPPPQPPFLAFWDRFPPSNHSIITRITCSTSSSSSSSSSHLPGQLHAHPCPSSAAATIQQSWPFCSCLPNRSPDDHQHINNNNVIYVNNQLNGSHRKTRPTSLSLPRRSDPEIRGPCPIIYRLSGAGSLLESINQIETSDTETNQSLESNRTKTQLQFIRLFTR